MSDNNDVSPRVTELLQDLADSKNIRLVGSQRKLGTGTRDYNQARLEAVGFKELGRASVVCWWQKVAGHKNESRFAGHYVIPVIWKRMMMAFNYNYGDNDHDNNEMYY